MEKIRVLEMIDQPFLGGGQIALLSLAKHLNREKFEVSVCSGDGGPLVAEVKKNSISHFAVPFSKKFRGRIIGAITSILKKNQIDILHTHGGVAGFYGRWAASRCQTPVIIHTLHGIHYLHYRNVLKKRAYIFLERIFSRFTDALVFVSDSDMKKGRKLKLASEAKMCVIKNGIDIRALKGREDRESKKRELGLDLSQPIVGTVARLHRQKGIIYLLRAAEKIHQVFPVARIVIVGGGPLRKKLEDFARKLRLEDFLFFLGEREDAHLLLSLFDVFVLPSLWEGLPYVLLEAASLSRPIIATDIDGTREVIKDHETGILVPPQNSQKLAEATIKLLADREFASRLAEKARENIPPAYPLSRMVEETQSLYLRLYRKTREARTDHN